MVLPFNRTVDFLIIGAAKSATTWLQKSLTQTPSIYMPGPEMHFFSREYHRGMDWYRSQFEDCEAASLIGEKSNSYLAEPQAASRIRHDFPDVRLIVQLRDPVQRAYSDYCMLYRRGSVTGEIRRYLDPDVAADQRFLSDSRYGHHLKRFFDLFPSEQILLLAYEDILQAPEEHVRKASEHIRYTGDLLPPLQKRVKDKERPMVPLPIRRLLKPLRPILDPVRDYWPIRPLRNILVRTIEYPPLPEETARKMRAFFQRDQETLSQFAPELCKLWASGAPSKYGESVRSRNIQ